MSDDPTKCDHCNGTGVTTNYCCFKAAGGKDDGRPCAGYAPHRCCACGGSGKEVDVRRRKAGW